MNCCFCESGCIDITEVFANICGTDRLIVTELTFMSSACSSIVESYSVLRYHHIYTPPRIKVYTNSHNDAFCDVAPRTVLSIDKVIPFKRPLPTRFPFIEILPTISVSLYVSASARSPRNHSCVSFMSLGYTNFVASSADDCHISANFLLQVSSFPLVLTSKFH